ncbi:MAG TPA: family 10 glycosylhydrolase [Micromonosporaceae bacterium]
MTHRRRLRVALLATALLGALAMANPASAEPIGTDDPSDVATLDTTGAATTDATGPGSAAPGGLTVDRNGCPVNPATPKRQLRGLWIASVVNIDWPSREGLDEQTLKAEYDGWLDMAQRLNMNAVFVQIRPTADAFWPSPYEPWSEFLTGVRGKDPGWDPLGWMVAETHKRNIEFHAWFNPYRVSMPAPSGAGADITKLAPNHPVRQHPDWAVAYPVNAAGSRLYYNPGIPDVRHFVEDAMMDAVTKYDIDGVHFDDYFYPYPAARQDFPDDATFARYGAGFTDKGDWRRHNIDLLIQEMDQRIHAAKPWVKFGVSPFGIWRNASSDPLGSDTHGTESYNANYADTRTWVKNEWLDYVVPQVYWNIGLPVADYAKLVPWWSDVVTGTHVQLYIGQADYKVAAAGQPAAWFDPNELSRHLTFNEQYNVSGDVHFSAVQVRADRLNSISILAADHYSKPALIPTMTQLPAKPVNFPVVTASARNASGAVTLTWHDTAQGTVYGDVASYVVYRFDGTSGADTCGFADAGHVVATLRRVDGPDQSWVDTTAEPGKSYTYYVTALDRLWNESNPSPARVVS